ncbi:MAG: hypothetical protein FDZ69_07425 [Deltaproteobacteria bacterium]|nr:MAG: hypothetical protein FDZ69_07425 [Deltaproteobacteria bacterium]
MANIRAIVVSKKVNALTVGRPGPQGPGLKEYANLAAFPATGLAGLIYLAQDTGLIYRWTGSGYSAVGGAAYAAATQPEAEAGTEAGLRSWSPLRVFQAAAAKVASMFGTTAGTICQGNDARLSDARPPTAHTHGGISNDGKVGSTAGLPLKTGTAGAVEAGAFGTAAGTFCEGNDSRVAGALPATGGTINNYREMVVTVGNFGSAYTIDLSLGSEFHGTLDQTTCALTMPAAPAAGLSASFVMVFTQGSGGGKGITASGALGPDLTSALPSLNTTAGKVTELVVRYNRTKSAWVFYAGAKDA